MTFSCSAVSGNRSWKASIAVATCDLPMKPWGHCVHVTKSASTRRRCGRASKPDAAVAEGGSRLSTAAVVVVVVMVAMINRAEEQRNMKLGQAKHQQRPRVQATSHPGFQLFTRVGNPIFARLFFSSSR